LLLVAAPRAQQAAPQSKEDRVALYQALLDLTNPWTVMCIAAHPDDEDGTSLIVMRRKYGAHTVSLFTTFGEGGQNAIGPELYEELGAIRVRETMAASEIQGSEPYFLGMKDFGFSKSADEAFKVWGHDEALRRMVLQIRKLRPDVIITNHSVTSNDHGHHQATARLELEAFDAAADPKRFPEQLKDGLTVWQVQRLFVRVRGNAAQSTGQKPDREGGRNDLVTIDPNERDPIRETVYAEEALRALQKHATQGPWPKTYAEFAARFRAFTGQSAAPGQLPPIRYALAREAKGAAPITKDSHNFLDGLRLPEEIGKQLAPPMIDGKPLTDFIDQREKLIPALAVAKDRMAERLADDYASHSDGKFRLSYQFGRIQSALLSAAGISAQLMAEDPQVPGTRTVFSFTISNRGSQPVQLEQLSPPTSPEIPNLVRLPCCPGDFSNRKIQPGESLKIPLNFLVPDSTGLTVPHAAHLYDDKVFGLAALTYAFARVDNTSVTVPAITRFDVAPPVEITSTVPSLLVLTPQTSARPSTLELAIKSHLKVPFKGLAGAFANQPNGKRFELVTATLSLSPGESREVSLSPKMKLSEFPSLEVDVESVRSPRSLVSKSIVPIIKADARVAPNLRVGYIRGFDYSLPNALNALGVELKELSVDEVKTTDLQKYSSIIVDNRVYESQPELIAANQKLLDYANAGGTLIVFYHKSDEWNPDERRKRPQLAPYKLILGNERITDENAPITFLEPEHALLNSPNKIGQEDFANWIQERGLYYPKEWDPQFHALLQSNDPGEAPLKGGLLVADYGRGHYIYSSMVWYRELRAGVPGAYRMLANMISYGHAEGKR
jgi:LmbE family N-acetylglucosaminyl deacetylase